MILKIRQEFINTSDINLIRNEHQSSYLNIGKNSRLCHQYRLPHLSKEYLNIHRYLGLKKSEIIIIYLEGYLHSFTVLYIRLKCLTLVDVYMTHLFDIGILYIQLYNCIHNYQLQYYCNCLG